MTQQTTEKLGQLIIVLYLFGGTFPLSIDIPLFVLSIGSVTVIFLNSSQKNNFMSEHLYILAIFLILMSIAIASSENITHSLFSSVPFLPAILIFFLVISCFKTTGDIFRLYLILSLLSLVLSLSLLREGLITGIDSPHNWINQFANPLLVVPNDSIIFSIIAPLSIVLILRNPPSYSSIIAGISMLLSIISIILLRSRGALLIMIVSILPIILSQFRFKKSATIIVSIIVIIVVVDGTTGFELLDKLIISGRESRIPLWIAAWELFLNHPLLGYGPHMFVFHYQENLPLDGKFITDTWVVPWTHNLYLELLAEQGLLVMVAFVSLITFNLYHAKKISKHNGKISLAGLGIASSLTGFVVASAIELSFLRIWVVLIFFILLAIIHNLSANLQETYK